MIKMLNYRAFYAIVWQLIMDEVNYSGTKTPFWKKFSKKSILILVFILIVLGLIGGIFYFVTRDVPGEQETKTIELPDDRDTRITEEPEEPEDTPTPAEEELLREDISVSIQNGSGEGGVAGEASDILTELGYEIVSTGNADNFEYENVTIRVKASARGALSLLEEDLGENYTIGETSSDLPEDEAFDALVIIGA